MHWVHRRARHTAPAIPFSHGQSTALWRYGGIPTHTHRPCNKGCWLLLRSQKIPLNIRARAIREGFAAFAAFPFLFPLPTRTLLPASSGTTTPLPGGKRLQQRQQKKKYIYTRLDDHLLQPASRTLTYITNFCHPYRRYGANTKDRRKDMEGKGYRASFDKR